MRAWVWDVRAAVRRMMGTLHYQMASCIQRWRDRR
jgi:hypothetical protein